MVQQFIDSDLGIDDLFVKGLLGEWNGVLFVFVEGPDDERFITSVLGNDKIKVIKYAREKKEYINRYIKSIKSIPNYDYIVICDIDLKSLVEKRMRY